MSADDIKKLVDKTVISVSAKESLGIDELSVSPACVLPIRKIVRDMD